MNLSTLYKKHRTRVLLKSGPLSGGIESELSSFAVVVLSRHSVGLPILHAGAQLRIAGIMWGFVGCREIMKLCIVL
jgi:hypothetical protein